MQRKTSADYHALATERGFQWLGPEVRTVLIKTGWECEHHHRWQATYNSIQQGSGCPFCAGTAPKTADDYRALAEERGFRWLGPEVRTTITKTTWQCGQGHRWEAQYQDIRNGTGCPICYEERTRTRPDDYHALARARGFRWLGPEAPNTHVKTWWECAEGHRWEMRYNDIKQGGGCPICARERRRKQPGDYRALAEERGFEWLGPEVHSVEEKTGWRCKRGHRWEAVYSSVDRGTGCPHCYRARAYEERR
jgi:hypothetical protein